MLIRLCTFTRGKVLTGFLHSAVSNSTCNYQNLQCCYIA